MSSPPSGLTLFVCSTDPCYPCKQAPGCTTFTVNDSNRNPIYGDNTNDGVYKVNAAVQGFYGSIPLTKNCSPRLVVPLGLSPQQPYIPVAWSANVPDPIIPFTSHPNPSSIQGTVTVSYGGAQILVLNEGAIVGTLFGQEYEGQIDVSSFPGGNFVYNGPVSPSGSAVVEITFTTSSLDGNGAGLAAVATMPIFVLFYD